ncbi:hypothetical protein DL93DRAFT_2082729 [Clavulina sp. PMI_390]|nr:hypothetical protein DL93DRAFT_2082729 [Clavulina sp. PMI_390]
MHDVLRVAAAKEGYTESDGSLVLLPLGAEDLTNIGAQLKAHGIESVDTIISFLSFCSVPNAKTAVPALVQRYLKSGGELLFYEHVRSRREDVQWYQDAWVPVWRLFFGGCIMGQPTDDWIDSMDCWAVKDRKGMDNPEEEESLFPHSIGHYVKG